MDRENMGSEEEEHTLRLSVELNAVKELLKPSNLYVKFSYGLLGSTLVRSQTVEVQRQSESRIESAFKYHEFSMTRSELYPSFCSTPLIVEVVQTDRFAKDELLGKVTIQMEELLRAPLKKTPQSYLRVLDTWSPIDSEEGQRVGLLRAIIYLEDLGPKATGAVLSQEQAPAADYQAAWELELWRRAEEAKWKAGLKEKENQHLASMSIEWTAREQEREKLFAKSVAELGQLEAKLRSKILELQKREQKIASLDEELRQKLNETSRQVALKEEEIQALKTRFTESRTGLAKENKSLAAKVEELKTELGKTEEALRVARREQDSSAVQGLRKELDAKQLENIDLRRKLDQVTGVKESFKTQFEKMKGDMLRLAQKYEEEKQEWQAKEREELTRLRLLQEASQTSKQGNEEVKSLKQQLEVLQQLVNIQPEPSVPQPKRDIPKEIPVLRPLPSAGSKIVFKGETKPQSDLARLIEEREMLLESGAYSLGDALITELDRQIGRLR
jgi:centrosomal protein CEP120